MSEKLNSLITKAMTVNCDHYYLRCSELLELAEQCHNNFIEGSFILFRIGFLKGQRAERAKQKKKRQKEVV